MNTDIPGLVYRKNENIIINRPHITGYVGNPKTDWSLIDMKRYKRHAVSTPAATVMVKSGCPYGCSFCDSRTTMGNRFIFCDIDQIIAEIKTIKKLYGMRWFFLNGLCFNSPLDFAKRLLQRIIDENLNIRFMARLYPIRNCFDDEFFELYKNAGGYYTMVEKVSWEILMDYFSPNFIFPKRSTYSGPGIISIEPSKICLSQYQDGSNHFTQYLRSVVIN